MKSAAILRATVAWAHDWVGNPAPNASFESLAGTSFTVNGAPIPHDSALTSAGAQLFFTPNWSFLAKFDGEFADGYQLYDGSGRYATRGEGALDPQVWGFRCFPAGRTGS